MNETNEQSPPMSPAVATAAKGLWLGGFENGLYAGDSVSDEFPAIFKLARKFDDFQNSPYRGEWNQKSTMTFGEMRELLGEIARLMQKAK